MSYQLSYRPTNDGVEIIITFDAGNIILPVDRNEDYILTHIIRHYTGNTYNIDLHPSLCNKHSISEYLKLFPIDNEGIKFEFAGGIHYDIGLKLVDSVLYLYYNDNNMVSLKFVVTQELVNYFVKSRKITKQWLANRIKVPKNCT